MNWILWLAFQTPDSLWCKDWKAFRARANLRSWTFYKPLLDGRDRISALLILMATWLKSLEKRVWYQFWDPKLQSLLSQLKAWYLSTPTSQLLPLIFLILLFKNFRMPHDASLSQKLRKCLQIPQRQYHPTVSWIWYIEPAFSSSRILLLRKAWEQTQSQAIEAESSPTLSWQRYKYIQYPKDLS